MEQSPSPDTDSQPIMVKNSPKADYPDPISPPMNITEDL
jgi:hypothetical protein